MTLADLENLADHTLDVSRDIWRVLGLLPTWS
jgi:hypothetical protein